MVELTIMEEIDDTSLLDKVVPSSSADEMEQNTNKQSITKEPSDLNIINTELVSEAPCDHSITKSEQGHGSRRGKLIRENEAGRRKKVRHEQNTNKQPEEQPITKEPSDHNIINTKPVSEVPSDQGRGSGNGKRVREKEAGRRKKVRREQNTNKQPEEPSDQNIDNIEPLTKVPSDQNIIHTKPITVTEGPSDHNIINIEPVTKVPSDQNIINTEPVTATEGPKNQNIINTEPRTKVPSDQNIIHTKAVTVTEGPTDQNINTEQGPSGNGNGKHVSEIEAGHKKKVRREQKTNKQPGEPSDQNIINTESLTNVPGDENIIHTEPVTVTEGPRDQNINTEQGRGNGNGKHVKENEAGHKKKVKRAIVRYMDHDEFFDNYPSIYAKVHRCGPYHCTPKKAVIEALLFISPKSLDKLEEGWMNYYIEGLEVGERRMALKRKMVKLLYQAQLAYKEKS